MSPYVTNIYTLTESQKEHETVGVTPRTQGSDCTFNLHRTVSPTSSDNVDMSHLVNVSVKLSAAFVNRAAHCRVGLAIL